MREKAAPREATVVRIDLPFFRPLKVVCVYCILGNFWSVTIFIMEIFDHGNIRKGQPSAKFIYIQLFTLAKITHVKTQE